MTVDVRGPQVSRQFGPWEAMVENPMGTLGGNEDPPGIVRVFLEVEECKLFVGTACLLLIFPVPRVWRVIPNRHFHLLPEHRSSLERLWAWDLGEVIIPQLFYSLVSERDEVAQNLLHCWALDSATDATKKPVHPIRQLLRITGSMPLHWPPTQSRHDIS